MNDHSRYEELAALSAVGDLSESEITELHEHLAVCNECKQAVMDYRGLVSSGLPVIRSSYAESLNKLKARPEAGARERFLIRARSAGVRFSPNVEKPSSVAWGRRYPVPIAAALAAVLLVAVLYRPFISRRMASATQAQVEMDRLAHDNAGLVTRLVGSDQEVARQQREIQDLRNQNQNLTKTSEAYRRQNDQNAVRIEQSTSQTAQLQDELQNREKQLAQSTDELSRINQLRATDEASLVAQQVQINEISDQLRIASATLDVERRLAAAGGDIRELLVARQLHVVDVRDTDVNGKPSRAFARVFLTEGKSLTLYAFDLNEGKLTNTKAQFHVWGEQLGQSGSVRSLGLLYADDKAQKRWALKLSNPNLLTGINSVFVTVANPGDGTPSGQRLLYAYLGQPNHQ